MEVEVGQEESVWLEQAGGDGGEEEATVSNQPAKAAGLKLKDESLQDLEMAMKNLRKDASPEEKSNLILKLTSARESAILDNRQVWRMSWRKKSMKEVRERAEFQERMVFLLPEEWEAVLKQVEDPEDKGVMSDMSLVWRAETKRDWTRFLFNEVFKIMNESGHLTQADMLGCRLACQQWKESVDSYSQNLLDYPKPGEGTRIRQNLWKNWKSVARFREWCDRTYATGSNPFPFRKISIENPPPPRAGNVRLWNRRFWRESEQLLREWGGEIWDVFLSFEGGLEFETLLDRLIRFLGLMPNLRYLCIVCHRDDFVGSRMVMPFLLNMQMGESLPALSHVKVLDLYFFPPHIINGMLGRYRSSLETLRLYAHSSNPVEYAGGTNLPRLKNFDLTSSFFHDLELVEELSGPQRMTWPTMEEMTLMYYDLEAEAARVPQVFDFANALGGTLQSLALILHKEAGPRGKLDESQLKKLRLDLPRVEKFSLSVCRLNLKGIDFILPMVALKELCVTYFKIISGFEKKKQKGKVELQPASASSSGAGAGENSKEIIQFWEYTNRLYESNIWKLFPDLRKVIIRVAKYEGEEGGTQTTQKIYTREGYKQHLASGLKLGEV